MTENVTPKDIQEFEGNIYTYVDCPVAPMQKTLVQVSKAALSAAMFNSGVNKVTIEVEARGISEFWILKQIG